MYDAKGFAKSSKELLKILKNAKDIGDKDVEARKILNNATYTIQQSIGAALDGLNAGKSNTARKLNGVNEKMNMVSIRPFFQDILKHILLS